VRFEWDQSKSTGNEVKHGIDFAAAAALWDGPLVSIPSKTPGEERNLAIGVIDGRHWTVIYTPRGDRIRIISARRSRDNEKALHKNHFPQP
jgi:uncharacterized DUF497 family protein